MTRAAIYARFSSDLQDERSIARQVADLRAEADKKGWEVVEVFTDEGISGESIVQRAGVKALLAAAAAGRFEVVLTEALDRVSRNHGHTFNIYDELQFAGVEIHRPARGAATEIDIFVEGLVASQQMKGHREKVRSGQRETTRRGRSAGGLAYGYDVVKQLDKDGEPMRGLRRINEPQAAVIRRILAEYVAGVAPLSIVDRLNKEGIPAPAGGAWSVSTIIGSRGRGNGILHNRLYAGELVYNRVKMVKHPKTGLRISRLNPESAWTVTQCPELAIVDRDTWGRAQALRVDRGGGKTAAVHHRRPKHLLAGLARCGVCAGALSVHSEKYLRCSSYTNKRTCRNARKVDRPKLEGKVLEEIRRLLASPAAVAAAMKELHDERARLRTLQETTRRSAARELSDIGGKIARLVAALEAGGNDLAAITGRIRELEARRAALTAEIAAANAELKVVELAPDAPEIYAKQVADLERALFATGAEADEVTRAEAMGALRSMITIVNVYPRPEPGRFFVNVEGEIRLAFDLASARTDEHPRNKRGLKGGSGGPYKAFAPHFRRTFLA